MSPDASEAVGLQLHAYRQPARVGLVHLSPHLVELGQDAGKVLDMVADFTCKQKSISDFAFDTDFANLLKANDVEVNFMVFRAIKDAIGCGYVLTGRPNAAAE